MQDSRSQRAAKPWGSGKVSPAPDDLALRLRVLVLGANVWVIGALWPLLAASSNGAAELALSFLCPVPLLLAVLPSWPAAWLGLRTGLLLVGYPCALAALTAVRPEPANRELFGVFGSLVLWLSLCAYAAFAALATTSRAPELPAVHLPIRNEGRGPSDGERRSRALRSAFVAVCALGALALALIAPRVGGSDALEHAWGDAAESGAVLTSVVGAALGVGVLGVYLGNGLRGGEQPDPAAESPFRTAGYLLVALVAFVTFLVIQP